MKEKLKLKILFCLFGLASLTFTGCVKQSNCDCGMKGKFVYNPYWSDAYNTTIKAVFIPENDHFQFQLIEGFIPNEFRVQDTLYISACTSGRSTTPNLNDSRGVYKLNCIEKAN